jgi:hypothetical protein
MPAPWRPTTMRCTTGGRCVGNNRCVAPQKKTGGDKTLLTLAEHSPQMGLAMHSSLVERCFPRFSIPTIRASDSARTEEDVISRQGSRRIPAGNCPAPPSSKTISRGTATIRCGDR